MNTSRLQEAEPEHGPVSDGMADVWKSVKSVKSWQATKVTIYLFNIIPSSEKLNSNQEKGKALRCQPSHPAYTRTNLPINLSHTTICGIDWEPHRELAPRPLPQLADLEPAHRHGLQALLDNWWATPSLSLKASRCGETLTYWTGVPTALKSF